MTIAKHRSPPPSWQPDLKLARLLLPHLPKQKTEEFEPLPLAEFVRSAWHVLEPATPYLSNWHIDVISDVLSAVTRGELQRLVINVPPGAMKSLLCCVLWPAWEWAEVNPASRWLFSSYDKSLSTRDSVKCRRVIKSEWYQQRYGHQFRLTGDQDVKTLFENDATGFRMATSVGGSGTGNRADRVVVDDPHKVTESESDAIRSGTVEWWATEMSNRGSSAQSAYVVIQQRVHFADVAGWCLDNGYEHLIIPQEYEGQKHFILGQSDPRDGQGDLLWPDRFDPNWVASQKQALGSYAYAGQHQQRPVPREGGMIKLAWFNRYDAPPDRLPTDKIILSLDSANKAKELNDPSVATIWLARDERYYLLWVWRDRVEYPDLKRNFVSLCQKWQPTEILIEDKASGTQLIQEMRGPIDGRVYSIISINPEGDKIMRMSLESPAIESGRIWLPNHAPWLPDYEAEMTQFPRSATKDQVDSTSQFLMRMRSRPVVTAAAIKRSAVNPRNLKTIF
jgi:predicted phage terminase large subunit-like protein